MASVGIQALLWIMYLDWQLRGAEYAQNLFLFVAWSGSILGMMGPLIAFAITDKNPVSPAWAHSVTTTSWVALILFMAGQGRFGLAACMTLGFIGSLVFREAAIDAKRREATEWRG